jgi:hypothetical protein
LSYNQFSGVLDGNLRNSGHVDVLLNYNNISVVANLPSPFLNPVYGIELNLKPLFPFFTSLKDWVIRAVADDPSCV